MNNRNVYDIEVSDYKGLTYKLEAFRGKVILVVNTATECIYSEQLKKLETLFQKYKDRGFVVLSFPNNNFDNRQPGSNEEILKISREKFGVTFPVLAKISVNGNNEHPLFTHLKNEQPGIFGSPIKWNFTKFIIDRQGNVVNRFLPMEDPLDISTNIEILLQESSS
ncbi:glutathione peroxidase [Staphylococcus aureus]|nr:glutathione peroxidase [Staphylococcus aureus]WRN78723.1 glutathione peroxidase [Staphylococcus aureus]HDB5326957.1 glutathione peroxidase [Staphylococcus aureus]HDB5329101.1 glutathione peroxidase [Staphylococcus aureus]